MSIAAKNNLAHRLFLTTDSLGGWIAVVVGLISLSEALRLGIGSATRWGSGAFPLAIGALLVALGASLIVGSVRKGSSPADIPVKASTFLVLASLASFAVILPNFGLVPAALILMLLTSMAVTGSLKLADFIFAAVMSAAAVLIFVNGLGLALPIVRWPF